MSQGRKELRSVRLRLETTPGVAAPPRFVWRGLADMPEDQREVNIVEELVGIFGGTDRSYIPKIMGEITLGETELTFEQGPLLTAAAGLGTAGGSLQGANGSTAVWTHAIPTTTTPVIQSFTIEAGDNVEAEQLTFCVVNELELSFQGGEAVKAQATWMAREVTRANAAGTFNNVGTLVTPAEVILAGRGTVWLNPAVAGASFGQVQGTPGNILGGRITFSDMWEPKFPIDSGALTYSTAVWVGIKIEGEITFEHWNVGSTGIAGTAGQKQAWRDQQAHLLRLRWTGGTIPNGTTYDRKMLEINLPVKWTSVEAMDDQNGNSIITASFESKYNEAVPDAGRGTILWVRRGQLEHLN